MAYRVLVFLHRWAGLAMAAFLVVVGVTGSLLAFRNKIDALVNPRLHVRSRPQSQCLDLATLAERAEAIDPRIRPGYYQIEPDQVLISLRFRMNPATGRYYTEDEIGFDHLVLDPYSGAELGRLREGKILGGGLNVMGFIYDLHTALLLGNSGALFLGVVALVWTLDSFVGFYLTLPRGSSGFWKRWKNAWQVKWRASSFRVNFDLHRAGGLWFWLLLFLFAWSSVMLGLRPVYERVTSFLFDNQTGESLLSSHMLRVPKDNPKLNWRQALEASERIMMGQAAQHGFTIDRPYGLSYIPEFGVYSYSVRCSKDIRGHGWDAGLWLDGDTGTLSHLFLPSGQHTGNTFTTVLWALHYGDLRDVLLYRALVFIFGLVLTALSVTGVYIWWRKWQTRRASKHRRPRNADPVVQPSA